MKKSLLLSLSILAGLSICTSAFAQTMPLRGEEVNGFEATQKSIELQLIVEEIEDAGFDLDVLEGFEEEWEEEIWVDAASEEMDANYLDPNETERFDLSDVPAADEISEEWEEITWNVTEDALDESEDFEPSENIAMRGEDLGAAGEFDLDLDFDESLEEELNFEEIETAELNWWEEENEWQDVFDDMEMETEEFLDVEEDLDFLEELYDMS